MSSAGDLILNEPDSSYLVGGIKILRMPVEDEHTFRFRIIGNPGGCIFPKDRAGFVFWSEEHTTKELWNRLSNEQRIEWLLTAHKRLFLAHVQAGLRDALNPGGTA